MSYGNNGNRWWVGLNVGSDNSTIFGTGSILSPNGYESLPSGNAVDDAKFTAAAAYNKAHPSKPNTISVEHVSWFNINGPYPTQAAANAALPAIAKQNPAPGEFQQITAGGQNQAANGGGVNLNSVTGFLGDLTSANLWIRVGKILIGGVILTVGLIELTGQSKTVKGIAGKAVKAAPFLL